MAVLALVAALVPIMPAVAVTGQPVVTMDEIWVDATVDGPGTGTESDPFRLVTDALAHAAEGATIYVGAGEYGPDDGETLPLMVPSGVSILGEWDPIEGHEVVFYGSGEGDSPIMMLDGAEGVLIQGIVFMENANFGFVANSDMPSMAAGIQANGSQLTIDNCVFEWLIGFEGSALLAIESDVVVNASVFAFNGMYMMSGRSEVPDEYADELAPLEKLSPDDSPVTMQISYPETAFGGAVLGAWSDMEFNNTLFGWNGASQAGGALLTAYGSTATNGCEFFDNRAFDDFFNEELGATADVYAAQFDMPFGGGAVNNYMGVYDATDTLFLSNDCWAGAAIMADGSATTVTRSGLYDNGGDNIVALDYSVESDSIASFEGLQSLELPEEPEIPEVEVGLDIDATELSYGYGEYMVYAGVRPARITNSLFTNNECGIVVNVAPMGIGAILPEPPDFGGTSSIEGSTFSRNWAEYGVVVGDGWEYTSLVNSIIWDNMTEGDDAYHVHAWNNDIEGDLEDVGVDEDNISVDPEFADPDGGDFHLLPSSPCIDVGSDMPPVESDIEFDPRPWDFDYMLRPVDGDEDGDAQYDMGAYEYLPNGRIGGENRYETAISTSQQFFGAADTVVLATGRAFADGLAGSGLAGMYNAPLLLTNGATLLPAVADEIERLGASRVFVLGGPVAIAPAVEEALWDMGLEVDRIGGIDRYETAAMIADHMLSAFGAFGEGSAFIARGDLFPDALAAAPIAYANHMPVLLVHPDQLPEHTVDIIRLYGVTSAVVIGGNAAVSASVADDLDALADDVTRISGANRYETAANLAEWAWDEDMAGFWVSGVATGDDFADALSGGAGIGSQNGVLLLTPYASVAPACEDAVVDHKSEIATLQTFGGLSAISDDVYDYLMELLD
jgi:putative cell wall-binding protein